MPFIHTYNSAVKIIQSYIKGNTGKEWFPIIKRAIKNKKNPLNLTSVQKKKLTKMLKIKKNI